MYVLSLWCYVCTDLDFGIGGPKHHNESGTSKDQSVQRTAVKLHCAILISIKLLEYDTYLVRVTAATLEKYLSFSPCIPCFFIKF